ncbi:MAG: hypothetical protein ACRDVL_08990 [Acidimicrobiia bacterium]
MTAARRQLAQEGTVVLEQSDTKPSVTTIRLRYSPGKKRSIQRLRGARRKLYRRYLSWAFDYALCGRAAEEAVLASAQAVASEAALWVPPQKVGAITEVLDYTIAPRTLDVLAFALEPSTAANPVAITWEVKNIHSWIYPWAPELWELLVKVAELAESGAPVLPVIVCPRAAWQTWQMAQDVGFFTVQLGRQIFSPEVPEEDFKRVVDEFALVIERFAGVDSHVVAFLTKTMRRAPPPPPPKEETTWIDRAVDRFRALASTILRFESLASSLPDETRAKVWEGARAALRAEAGWPVRGGW